VVVGRVAGEEGLQDAGVLDRRLSMMWVGDQG
jgi:hypothetical protein